MHKLLSALFCVFALAACGSDDPAKCLGASTQCGGTCVDTAHDQLNCGGCGIACNAHEACTGGTCTEVACLTGSTSCGEACVDLASDQNNCGACGNACAGGKVCSAGACTLSCTTGNTVCDGACVDTTSDRDHCGACGTVCAAEHLCLDSVCTVQDWQTLDDSPSWVYGFSTNVPAAETSFYALFDGNHLRRIDNGTTYVDLADLPGAVNGFNSLAHLGGKLFTTGEAALYAYSIADNTWSTPIDTLDFAAPDGGRQIAVDDDGFLYFVGKASASITYQLAKVDSSDFSIAYFDLPAGVGNEEPRTVYDSASKRVYIGDYSDSDSLLFAFDPATNTFSAALAPHPEAMGYNDGFCTDQRGHLFTSIGDGEDYRKMWMYTASTNAWTELPPAPFGVSNAGSCVVAGGWLYFAGDNDPKFDFGRYPVGR